MWGGGWGVVVGVSDGDKAKAKTEGLQYFRSDKIETRIEKNK